MPDQPATSSARRLADRVPWNASRSRRLAALVVPILLWEVGSQVADNRLLPGPVTVATALREGLVSGSLGQELITTLSHGFIGLGLAIIAGLSFGFLLARNRWAEVTLQPIMSASYPIPKLALYPILLLLLGFGGPAKIAMVVLECAYPIAYNTYGGVSSVDKRYLWLSRNVGASRTRTNGVLLRAALPTIMASLRIAVPIMLVVMVITEMLGESRGLGFAIRQASTSFRPADVLAVLLLLAIIGYALDRVVVKLTAWMTPWARGVTL